LQTEWTKPSYNPIVNGTGDDPSTAWLTADGEWRMIGNQGCDSGAPIYGSKDFVTWYKIGCTTLRLGDCPTFFPLPPLTPGTVNTTTLPTHVHKAGSNNDVVQIGTWTDGIPGPNGTTGTWEPTPGVPFGSTPVDTGTTHASKDFWDPVKNRRILWVGTPKEFACCCTFAISYSVGSHLVVKGSSISMMSLLPRTTRTLLATVDAVDAC